jgi:hypothetical protein
MRHLHYVTDFLSYPIRVAYPHPTRFLRLPDDPKVRYPFFYLLFAATIALIANVAAISYLFHWQDGWFWLICIFAVLYVVTLLHKTTNLLIEQTQIERDSAVDESIRSNQELRNVLFDLTEHCLTTDGEGARCRACESRDPLLKDEDGYYKFNALAHNPGCSIPQWRKELEHLDWILDGGGVESIGFDGDLEAA